MSIAKVFRSGNSHAVRLPKAFRVESKELEIFRRGDEIVLRERSANLERAFRALGSLPVRATLVGARHVAGAPASRGAARPRADLMAFSQPPPIPGRRRRAAAGKVAPPAGS